jgi:hypothetical protein
MSTPADWINAFARQAKADFESWLRVKDDSTIHECHKLQYLQMACEKLCKAHRIDGGTDPSEVQSSHAFIANPLPQVIAAEITRRRGDPRTMRGFMHFVKQIAGEIETLAPTVKRGGRRPDNCEYPWEDDQGRVFSPLSSSFNVSGMLANKSECALFIQMIQGSLQEILA